MSAELILPNLFLIFAVLFVLAMFGYLSMLFYKMEQGPSEDLTLSTELTVELTVLFWCVTKRLPDNIDQTKLHVALLQILSCPNRYEHQREQPQLFAGIMGILEHLEGTDGIESRMVRIKTDPTQDFKGLLAITV